MHKSIYTFTKISLGLIALLSYPLSSFAQLSVNAGSNIKIVANGSPQIKVNGNWQNEGEFTPGTSTVTLDGAGNQNLLNTSGVFYNITINKTAGEVLLAGDIAINGGALTVTSGDLDLNGYIATLDATATLNETSGNTAKGTSGYLTTTRSITAPSADNIAGLGLTLTSSDDFSSTEIRRSHAAQTINSQSSMLRTFEVIPTNSGLTADIVFSYDESEVNGLTESDLTLYQSTDNGTSWSTVAGTLDATANTFTATGIDPTGLFTIAPEPATASLVLSIALQGRSDYSGDYTVGLYHETSFTQIQESTLSAGASGVVTISDITPGTYWITVKHPQYLQNVMLQTLAEGTNSLDLGTLLAGDANNDNFITALDFSILAISFNKGSSDTGYDDRADFNNDDFVTALDFSLLATNFNSQGSEPGSSLDNLEDRSQLPAIVDEVEFQFITPEGTVQLGEEFKVQLMANSRTQSVDAIVSLFHYDTDRLELVDLQLGTAFDLELENKVQDNGQVTLAAGTLGDFPSGKMELATLTFKAIGTGKAGLIHDWDQQFRPEATFGGQSVLGETYDANILIEGPQFDATIYPVPTDGFLTVEVENPVVETDVQVNIINMNGQVVYRDIVENTNRKRLDLTKLTPGVYNIQIRSGKETVRKQFVIAR